MSVLLFGSAAAAVAFSQSDAGGLHREIQARAEEIFRYDRIHDAELPAHLLRALSLTVAFHDDDGADLILRSLEARVKH